MPKTIATTPSWYWPDHVPRVLGVPPYLLQELIVERPARRQPSHSSLVSPGARLEAGEVARTVARAAAATAALAGADGAGGAPGAGAAHPRVAVCAGPTAEGAVLVLAAIASGLEAVLLPPGRPHPNDPPLDGVVLVLADEAGSASFANGGASPRLNSRLGSLLGPLRLEALLAASGEPAAAPGSRDVASSATLRAPLVCVRGRMGAVWHSHRSLLAGAVSLGAFLGPAAGAAWLSTFSPCTWEGLAGLTTCLYSGAALVLSEPGEDALASAAAEHPAFVLSPLEEAAATWGSRGRRKRGDVDGPVASLLTVDGPFDPDLRRTVAHAAGGLALTVFGMAETGVVLASHPSWYLDESVGIAVPNMHVVPADPDTGEPISTLWELVDQAMVTAWSPSLAVRACRGEDTASYEPGGFSGRRFVTGVLAASDPNGMLYLIGD